MSFNKWTIGFGILSGIAAVIGFVAVFFPDLFDLGKKEEYESIKMVENSNIEIEKLDEFLITRAEDGKIFKIDTILCDSSDSSERLEIHEDNPDIDSFYFSIISPISDEIKNNFPDYLSDDGRHCRINVCGSFGYYFPKSMVNEVKYQPECKQIKGYAYYPNLTSDRTFFGEMSLTFSEVPVAMIEAKKYK